MPALHAELDRTRQRGYATNFEESEPGIAALSASLGSIDGERAAFSIALPIVRYQPKDADKFAAHLITTVNETRATLGAAD